MGKPLALYVLGLFDDKDNLLFERLKKMVNQGYNCEALQLYAGHPFGAYSFTKEVRRLQQIIEERKPKLLIAHSLGAYIALGLKTACPVIFLDPSLSPAEIFLPNIRLSKNTYKYNDGQYRHSLSSEFIESIKNMPSAEQWATKTSLYDVHIFGAGRGAYKKARKYLQHLPNAHRINIPNADHSFSNMQDLQKIISAIKERLDVMSSR